MSLNKHKRRPPEEESDPASEMLPEDAPAEPMETAAAQPPGEAPAAAVEPPVVVAASPAVVIEPPAAAVDAPAVAAASPAAVVEAAAGVVASPAVVVEAPAVAPTEPPPAEPPAQPPAASSRDSAALDPREFPQHPFPSTAEPRLNRFQVVVKRSALNAIHRHGASKTDVEVCGVLVGNVYHDGAGPFLYIQDVVRGDYAANNQAQVTFTDQTWNHINAQMEAKHPEQKIVGWYHTHPGFGIFLSKMDLFIHESFFNISWQAAFVYDPKSSEEGLFLWKNGLAERDEFLVEEDWASAPPEEEIPQPQEMSAAQAAALTEIKTRLRRLERRNRFLIVALLLLLLAAAAWPFVLFTIMSGGDFAATWRLLNGEGTPATQHE